MTPLILLKFVSEDVLGDMIVGYTKLYNHRGKPILMFEVTNEKVRFFLSMLLCSGWQKFPDQKYVGRQPQYIFVSKVWLNDS